MIKLSFCFVGLLLVMSCENKNLNEGEEFRPREVLDSFQGVTFSKITVDGIEYLMLERDNNNPHEGFGFMAFRANELMKKQDSIMAHLKVLNEVQLKIYAQIFNMSPYEIDSIYKERLHFYLQQKQTELNRLNESVLKNTISDTSNVVEIP